MPETYSLEFLAALRRRYEEDLHEPVVSIAAEFNINERAVSRIARREGWRMRSSPRELPQHVRIAEAVREAAAQSFASPPPERGRSASHSNGEPGEGQASGEGPPPGGLRPPPSPFQGEGELDKAPPSEASALDRLERLVLKEIAIEEAQRAALGTVPRPPAEAAHKARAYATLLQTMQGIERARNGEPSPATAGTVDDSIRYIADDMPGDIDEFRNELARRIDAFVASRTDAGDAAGSSEPELVEADG